MAFPMMSGNTNFACELEFSNGAEENLETYSLAHIRLSLVNTQPSFFAFVFVNPHLTIFLPIEFSVASGRYSQQFLMTESTFACDFHRI